MSKSDAMDWTVERLGDARRTVNPSTVRIMGNGHDKTFHAR
ncbi:hypothetical protein [Streptomyces sannanensis]